MHVVELVALVLFDAVPKGHFWHPELDVSPKALENVPLGQGKHCAAFVAPICS